MDYLKGVRVRLRGLFFRDVVERELAEEMRFHVEMETEKYMRAGLDPAESRRRARLLFGGTDRWVEQHRDGRGLGWLGDLGRDVRHAARTYRRSPAFTVVAVLTLALAMGAVAIVFTIVNALLLRPFPTAQADRLAAVWAVERDGGVTTVGYDDYMDWRDRSGLFEMLAARADGSLSVNSGGGAAADLVWAEMVSDNYFAVLGVRATLGRTLADGDGGRVAEPNIVLGHAYWEREFGADTGVVGRTVLVNGSPFTVIGVAPEGFHGVRRFGFWPEVWVPLGAPGTTELARGRGEGPLILVGVLAEGLEMESARSAAAGFARALAEANPATNRELGVLLTPARAPFDSPQDVPPRVLVLASAVSLVGVGLVLLIACVNVANLMLARASARRREMCIRLAMGGSRSRLVRQLLAEAGVLAVLGGALGLVLSLATRRLQPLLMPDLQFRVGLDVVTDQRVLLFTAMVAFGALFLFGLAPALRATRVDVVTGLKGGSAPARPSARPEMRDVLVVGQVAISVLLLVAGALFLRSLGETRGVDLGIDADGRVLVSADPRSSGHDRDSALRFHDQVRRRVEALPGVTAAAWGFPVPFDTYGRSADVYIEGVTGPTERQTIAVPFSAADQGFFDALGTRMLAGRDFAAQDTTGAPGVVVVNATMAERHWKGLEAVGQTVRLGGVEGRELRVIGVVEDAFFRSPRYAPAPYMFLSMRQVDTRGLTLVVHTRDGGHSVIPGLRAAIASVDPAVAAYGAITMRRAVRNALNLDESAAGVATVIGSLALLLAVIGLYGVVAYTVERRTREVGIRIALGATAHSVWRLVMLRAGATTLAGIAIGLLAAAAAGRGLSSLLFRVSATDPVAFLAVPLVLLGVTLVASFIPARRAARVDPVVALRAE